MAKFIRIGDNTGVNPEAILSYRWEQIGENDPVMWIHTTNGDLAVGTPHVKIVKAYVDARTTDIDMLAGMFFRRWVSNKIRRVISWIKNHLSRPSRSKEN